MFQIDHGLIKSIFFLSEKDDADTLTFECVTNLLLQKQPPEVFYKKAVFKNFTKFTGSTCIRVSF